MAGFNEINWTNAHPDGTGYIAFASGEESGWNDLVNGTGTGVPVPTSDKASFEFRKLWQNGISTQAEALVDCNFFFFIMV